jgi:hypothetical protein
MLKLKWMTTFLVGVVLVLGSAFCSQAGEIQEIQIGDSQPDHGAGEAPWGPEGTAERERRRAAKLDYTQAMDEFNAGNYEKSAQLIRNYLAVFPGDSQAQAFLARTEKLARAQRHGWLEVESRPQAEVFIDGKLGGKTPLKVELSVGPHEVEVRAEKRSQTGHVFIKSRTTHSISFDLHGRWLEEEGSKK